MLDFVRFSSPGFATNAMPKERIKNHKESRWHNAWHACEWKRPASRAQASAEAQASVRAASYAAKKPRLEEERE